MKTRFLFFLLFMAGTPAMVKAQLQLELELFASGFDQPIGVVNAGDDRLFVIEQRGLVRIADKEGNILETPFLDLSDVVSQSGFETGLLGLAFHPQYRQNGYVFVNYTREADGNTVVARFSIDENNPDQVIRNSEVQLFSVEQPYANHNGGQLLFGPDGYLYVALGDGGDAGDPHNNAQDKTTLLGKLLRLDVNADNDSAYIIPPDNPFVEEQVARGEIWAYGLRNPWRSSFDRYTGDLWIADVGQNGWEEVNFQPAGSNGGENYGWRCYEGNAPYNTEGCQGEANYVFPVYAYGHVGQSCSGSITGGYRYRGALYNQLAGVYVFADFCTGNVYQVVQTPDGFDGNPAGSFPATEITSFGEDQYGELYVVMQRSGELRRLTETGDCKPVARIMTEDSVIVMDPDSSILLQAFYHPSLEYQWFKEDAPLAGAVSHELAVQEEGIYTIEVTNPESGCSNVSMPVEIAATPTSVPLQALNQVTIYPNPAAGFLRIEGLPVTGKVVISLFDSKGVALRMVKIHPRGYWQLPVSNLPAGLYHLRIRYQSEVLQEKVLISNR